MVTKEVTCPTCNSKLEVKSRFAHLELSKHQVKEHKPATAARKKAVAKKATPRKRVQHKPLAPQGKRQYASPNRVEKEIKMVKKVTRTFTATLEKNTEKGGSWLCRVAVRNENGETETKVSAWSNASAGKRWVKAELVEVTGRKSLKFSIVKLDDNEKPTLIAGSVDYKVAL